MIPYGRQDISQEDIDAVVDVLRSDWLTQGPRVPQFEQAVADKVGAKYGVAVNSATSALHVACLALGLGRGDSLWTVPNTFVASANCARYCGATVDFVDIDPLTWNISVAKLREKLTEAKTYNRLPKVIVPVHFAGQPTDQEAIWELAEEFGFKVIEDASHSIGASRNGVPVGSCSWSHITVFSFHPVKIVTTGEGGMALTNDEELDWRMRMLRTHGVTREPKRMRRVPEGPWVYEQQCLGFNYRMTDIQASLGTSQLGRLDSYVKRRNQLARRYDEALESMPIKLPLVEDSNVSAFHLYVVRILDNSGRNSREYVFMKLRDAGIGVNVHYTPVHLQPYYRDQGFEQGQFPEAEAHGNEAITLPLYPTLTESEQDEVVATLRSAL